MLPDPEFADGLPEDVPALVYRVEEAEEVLAEVPLVCLHGRSEESDGVGRLVVELLEWARRRGCGFMETSARLEVNIEETFALIVRRVVESRRMAEMGITDAEAGMNSRGMTKPLSPLPGASSDDEKGGGRGPGTRGPNIHGDKVGRGGGGFWKRLRCW